jgi:V8-like Glu-specific endopeptidase
MSFGDLCADTYKLDKLLYTLLRQAPLNKVHVVASTIVHNQLSPNPIFLDDLANHYQIPLITDFGDKATDIGPAIEWRCPDDVDLHGFFQPKPDMMEVNFLKLAVERAASVCKIEIPHLNRTGTGFLIAPNLVLTNYHVLGLNDDEVKNNAAHVVLRFGYITEESNQTFNLVAKQPILSQSPVENGLDYVLLQVDNNLTKMSGIQPAPYELSQPTKGMGVHILQHPQGSTMKLAINDNGITGIYQSDGLIQYVTRALGGSSGAPCFNDDWKVVALHHAERAKSFGRIREGILFSAIYDRIKKYVT